MPQTFDSTPKSVGDLLAGQSMYRVPVYQRDFSWENEEISQLWEDLVQLVDGRRDDHFLGGIVAELEDGSGLTLIDGQQRLAALSVLMCALRDVARDSGDEQLANSVESEFLAKLDLDSRDQIPKLTLNDRNHGHYVDFILSGGNLERIHDELRTQSIHTSNRLLLEAYLYFRDRITERSTEQAEALVQLVKCVRDKLSTILITVSNPTDAYLIFETLNERGRELTTADLLKNFLFSIAAPQYLEIVKRQWDEIDVALGKHEITRFIRHYWVSYNGIVRTSELYRAISGTIKNKAAARNFASRLREAAHIYSAFDDSQHPIWDEFGSTIRGYIEALDLFGAVQAYPLLLAAYQTLDKMKIEAVLHMVVIFSFRYSVICSFGPGSLEAAYGEICKDIRAGKLKSAKAIFEKLKPLYPDDTTFERYFRSKSLRTARLVRYILAKLNSRYQGNDELIPNPDEERLNLEHILPKKPVSAWLAPFDSVQHPYEDYIHRLGNMTLLNPTVNRKAGNASFKEKTGKVFSKSTLEITRDVLRHKTWEPADIDARQARMAENAVQLWRLDY